MPINPKQMRAFQAARARAQKSAEMEAEEPVIVPFGEPRREGVEYIDIDEGENGDWLRIMRREREAAEAKGERHDSDRPKA